MPPSARLPRREARWMAIAAQGLASARPGGGGRGAGPAQLRRVMERVGTIQLDAVNVLARTQFLVAFSRLGSYDPAALRALSGPGRPWFEYWGHAASLLPVEYHPLMRWRMQRWRDDLVGGAASAQQRRAWRAAHAGYLAAVLAEVAERGPLTAAQLSEPRRRAGEWWERRSDGRRALELLFGDGVLAGWRSPSFERVYDLAERVIPAPVLALPTPGEAEAQRELVLLAARALGVASAADLADYFWLRPPVARARIDELLAEGRLEQVEVEGWASPGFIEPGARARRPRRAHATLLSPFDSLIWTRDRVERLFGFRYRIEIYVPASRRTHGYYVLPLLLGDRLVGRVDLKADRKDSALRVATAYGEPGNDAGTIAQATAGELHRLREWLGLSDVRVGERGDLAPHLAAAL